MVKYLFSVDDVLSWPYGGIVAQEALDIGRYYLTADAVLWHEPVTEYVTRHDSLNGNATRWKSVKSAMQRWPVCLFQ